MRSSPFLRMNTLLTLSLKRASTGQHTAWVLLVIKIEPCNMSFPLGDCIDFVMLLDKV